MLLASVTTLPAFLFVIYIAGKERGDALRRAEAEARAIASLASREHAHQVTGVRRMLERVAPAPDLPAILPAVLAGFPQVANLWIADSEGGVRYSVVAPPAHLVVRDNPVFVQARRSAEVVVGQYQVGPIVRRPVLLMARAVRGGDVLIAALDLSWLDQLATQSALVIADRSGHVLAGASGTIGGFAKLVESPGTMRPARIGGVDRLAVAVTLAGSPEIWVIAGPPESDVYAMANRVFYRDIAVLALLALFAVGASLIATDLSVLRDLRLLASATHRFGSGDLTARAPVPAPHGEIRELTIAFNEMADQLEQRQQRLRLLTGRLNAAREEEAARIAQELHDALGQELTVLKLDLENVRRKLDPAAIDEMEQRIDGAVQTVRRISSQLRPGVLDRLGLVAGLEWLLREFERHSSISTDLAATGNVEPAGSEISTALFRITQEALTNVARHAKASLVEVRLHREGNRIELRLHDDGRGFDPAAVREKPSLGLLGIEERARRLGGSVTIDSSPGAGTTLTVIIPIDHAHPSR
jgi:signal transduction histidine kinase